MKELRHAGGWRQEWCRRGAPVGVVKWPWQVLMLLSDVPVQWCAFLALHHLWDYTTFKWAAATGNGARGAPVAPPTWAMICRAINLCGEISADLSSPTNEAVKLFLHVTLLPTGPQRHRHTHQEPIGTRDLCKCPHTTGRKKRAFRFRSEHRTGFKSSRQEIACWLQLEVESADHATGNRPLMVNRAAQKHTSY